MRGAVEVPRVETAEAHENNEVTRLSSAFNRMLGNVESAFTAREASEKKLRRFVADDDVALTAGFSIPLRGRNTPRSCSRSATPPP